MKSEDFSFDDIIVYEVLFDGITFKAVSFDGVSLDDATFNYIFTKIENKNKFL
jgi:hypothetical protein